MNLDLVRTQYKTVLDSVPDRGVVHEYPRLATDWSKFLEFFKDPDTGKILGWEVSVESTPTVVKYISGVSPNRIADMKWITIIRGYCGLSDANSTDRTFSNLVRSVLIKFLPEDTLGGQVDRVEPMVAGEITERMFGGVLAHFVELRQPIWERVTY
jgi:hypothetical protein